MTGPESDPVGVALDGMIESTVEFIADDGLMADAERVADLAALQRVAHLWETVFREGMGE